MAALTAPDDSGALKMVDARFQILSLDGGGIKGIFAAAILAFLEDDLATSVVDHFDLIAGTSTGGIIALALGAGLSPREILDFYIINGPRIFRNRFRLGAPRHLIRPKYAAGPLRASLETVFGDRLLGSSQKRLVIPTYDLRADDVYVFKTRHHERLSRDWRAPLVDVALATAAAPTYFPGHEFNNSRLIDGAVWANSPVLVGVIEAVTVLGVPVDQLRVLSIGTTNDLRHRASHLDHGGIFQWLRSRDAINVVLRGQSLAAVNQVRHLLRVPGSDEDRHFQRIDHDVPANLLRLDRADTAELVGLAATQSRTESPRFRSLFMEHHAPPFVPVSGHADSDVPRP